MFLALGVAGLILLTGTDLSIGRMVGMGMVTATIIMHNGPNTGGVFGHIFDFSNIPAAPRAILALVACIILTTVFASYRRFLHGEVQDASFHLDHGEHADYLWFSNIRNKGCIIRCD